MRRLPLSVRPRQRGVSAMGVFIFFFVVFWIIVLTSKVGMPYWNAHIVHGDIVKSLDEQASQPTYDATALRMSIYQRAQVDNIVVPPDSVDVQIDDDNNIVVVVPYRQIVPVWSGATLQFDLPQRVQRNASKSAHRSLAE